MQNPAEADLVICHVNMITSSGGLHRQRYPFPDSQGAEPAEARQFLAA